MISSIKYILSLKLIFIFLFTNILLASEIGTYLPNTSESLINFNQVNELAEKVKTVQPPLKTRGIGTNIFRNVGPATVIIAAEEGMGSGFLINYDGLIVTNYHVIQKGVDSFSSDIKLVFCPVDLNNLQNSIVFQGRVLKIDRTRDLALIQMNSPVNKKISKIVRIDPNKSSVQVGMDVHAIGHPEG